MLRSGPYGYHLAALFCVTVWGATFVSTKVLIAHGLAPAEIFLLRFAMAYLGLLPFTLRRRTAGSSAAGQEKDAAGREKDAGRREKDAGRRERTAAGLEKDAGNDTGSPARRGLLGRLCGARLRRARLRDELLLAAAGLTGGSLYFLTENIALEYAPASNVSLIVCTAPVWTALLLSLVYRSERMTRRQTADCGLRAGLRRRGARRAQRTLRAAPLAAGRPAGPLGGAAVDALLARNQAPG
ncbi:DMT family transporter [uncultured Alistipes sp.]|uniref:DMT family transporter n=1 Tax=uncultured Alistipes sp. TaxID=538949 RepID=UPI0026651E5D|nr:DMT family transporter [uncultured Alistipes sp.]